MKIFIATFFALFANICHAAPSCMVAGDISEALLQKYAESPVFVGLDQRGALLLIYLSTAGTWTAVVAGPDGRACIIGSGNGGAMAAIPPSGEAR